MALNFLNNGYFAGKVGIGTQSGVDLLAVHNTSSGAVDAQMNFTTVSTGQGSSDGFRVGWNGTVAQMYLFENADMRFATNNVEAMLIQSDATVYVKGQNNGYDGTIRIGERAFIEHRDSGQTTTSIISNYNSDTAKINFKLKGVADAAAQMTILGSGNVGIGVTDPDAKLEIKASGSTTGLTFKTTDSAGNENFFIQDGGHTGVRYYPFTIGQASGTSPATGARFQVSTTANDFVVLNDSSTGIGTITPQSKLQVAGGIQMADDTDTASATKVGTMRYRTATDEPVPVTGIDFVTNGDFATDSDWTKSSNATISGGQATLTANSAAQYLIQGNLWPANTLSGQKVLLTYTIVSNSLNAGDFRIGGYTGASAFTLTGLPTAVGTHSVTLDVRTSAGDDNTIDLYITSAATSGALVIDNVSVIEVTEEDASYADMCMQTGALTYEWVNIVRNTY